jgi:hypothetical protein
LTCELASDVYEALYGEAMDVAVLNLHTSDMKAGWGASKVCKRLSYSSQRTTTTYPTSPFKRPSTLAAKR